MQSSRNCTCYCCSSATGSVHATLWSQARTPLFYREDGQETVKITKMKMGSIVLFFQVKVSRDRSVAPMQSFDDSGESSSSAQSVRGSPTAAEAAAASTAGREKPSVLSRLSLPPKVVNRAAPQTPRGYPAPTPRGGGYGAPATPRGYNAPTPRGNPANNAPATPRGYSCGGYTTPRGFPASNSGKIRVLAFHLTLAFHLMELCRTSKA